jgi:DNA invertase Pin-like site-specific DNA recombinase
MALVVALATALGAATSGPRNGVASYTRFSCANQDEKTISDQQRDCRNRAGRDGLSISQELEFADQAVSGATHSRKDFERMLAAARAGQIKVLYLANLSRLARDLLLTISFLRELVFVLKIRICTVDEAIDTSTNPNWELLQS